MNAVITAVVGYSFLPGRYWTVSPQEKSGQPNELEETPIPTPHKSLLRNTRNKKKQVISLQELTE